jgi:phosphoribosyl 1,2-cyclic phosphate phosphodiesterase
MSTMADFRLEILGSGGAFRTPRPGCHCRLCTGARQHGIPWERSGPSVFVHGPNLLIDTPEESAMQVDRAGDLPIEAGLYSHWHPDHTAGRRMYETRNWDARGLPPESTCTPIYLPPQVAADFEQFLGLAENFAYLQRLNLVDVRPFEDAIVCNGWRVTAHLLAVGYVYAFLFEEIEGDRRVLIAMDELHGWTPSAELCDLDLLYLPAGIFVFNPLTEERIVPEGHPVLEVEASYANTLEMIERLNARRIVIGHLEEPFGLTPDDYDEIAADLGAKRGWDVTFAHDTLVVELPM